MSRRNGAKLDVCITDFATDLGLKTTRAPEKATRIGTAGKKGNLFISVVRHVRIRSQTALTMYEQTERMSRDPWTKEVSGGCDGEARRRHQ
jgi:hypothetical protein